MRLDVALCTRMHLVVVMLLGMVVLRMMVVVLPHVLLTHVVVVAGVVMWMLDLMARMVQMLHLLASRMQPGKRRCAVVCIVMMKGRSA